VNRISIIAAATLALAAIIHAAPANAQNVRSFVSPTGIDITNPCTLAAPCRTFAYAITQTNAGGEIVALDAAGYGTLVINKAITIVSTAGAFIAVPSGGTGITITAGPNDDVDIAGLIIDGNGVGQSGIQFNTGKSLTVSNSVIRGMAIGGILFEPNASSALEMSNTVIKNANTAILVQPSSGTVTVSLSRVELYNHTNALLVNGNCCSGTITAVVADSVATNNINGFLVQSFSTPTRLMVIRSVSANNSIGLNATGAAATLRVGQSTLTGNTTSWSVSNSGLLRSYGDNNIDGNNDGDPTPTAIAKK